MLAFKKYYFVWVLKIWVLKFSIFPLYFLFKIKELEKVGIRNRSGLNEEILL